MPRPVEGTRTYDSSRRKAQARRTRAAVLEAARAAFLADGYAATTVAAIATTAGVSVETVYKAFGNKAGLLKTLFDVAIVGDDEPISLQQREMLARFEAEPDGRKKLQIYATEYAKRAERAVPIHLLVRDAAASDPAVSDVAEQLKRERLQGMTAFSRHLQEAKVLRRGVAAKDALDVLWLFTSPEVYEKLVIERGWTSRRFGTWISNQLAAALL